MCSSTARISRRDASGTSFRRFYVSIILGLLVLLLTACFRPAAGPPSSRAAASSAAPLPNLTSSVTSTATRTTRPYRTPRPTLTPTPRPPTRTPTISPTATTYSTLDPTGIIPTLEALRTETEVHLLNSPDGKWQAKLISQVCVQVGEESFIFYQLTLRQTGSDEERLILQDLGNCGLGAGDYSLTAWSPDSLWLYYNYRGIPDGDTSLTNPGTTIRLEAASGASTPLPNSGPVSPDQSQMAWTDGRDLVFYDLNSGEIQTYHDLLPADLPTYLVWQPEGAGIIFVQTEQPTYPYGSSTVGLITLDGMTVQVLHEGDDPALIALVGFEPGGILMGDDQGRSWFLSIPEGELTQR